jgi:hypothetical protein
MTDDTTITRPRLVVWAEGHDDPAPRDLPNRRPHFIGPIIEWAGVRWLIGVGLDPKGIACEVFADLADTEVEVEPAVIALVHAAAITASHFLRLGGKAAQHAERLHSQSPDLLCLMMRRAAETEGGEGDTVRALDIWRAKRLAGESIDFNDLLKASIAAFGRMSAAEQEVDLAAQRESWVRGETAMGLDAQEAADRAALAMSEDEAVAERGGDDGWRPPKDDGSPAEDE